MNIDQKSLPPTHHKFPEMSWDRIDRLDWQLWVLAILLIIVSDVGLLSFMFPPVFWIGEGMPLLKPERIFWGLCVLLGLALAYLLQRQTKLRRLKRELVIEYNRREEELIHDALYDPLTHLPNRELLLDRIRLSLSRAKRSKEYQFAVIFLDLDRFKIVNDSMGQWVGNQVLVEVGRRLQRCLRAEDRIARLGADEFGILLEDVKQMSDVTQTIERIRREFIASIRLDEKEVFTSATMGIAVSAKGYEQAEDVLRDAEIAANHAKAQGSGQYEVFESTMHERAVKVLTLETDLRRAIEREELTLDYQPIVWLSTGKVVGLEALVRWRHPERGLLSPAEFIPIAEASGLIVSITRLVLRQACRQLRAWQTECPSCWPVSVSVNLPAIYLTKEDQVEEIISVISEHGLRPGSIRLEITESQLMENAAPISRALLRLNDSGARVHIDDFGIGFSSLSYLSAFPVDALKIDQSFIRNSNGDDKNAAIVKSVIALGHNLGIDVIAEGIETAEQLKYLQAMKCQYGQGYFFARPLSPDVIGRSLAEWFPSAGEKGIIASRLRAFEPFAELDQEDLLEIAQACDEFHIPSGTVVIREGKITDAAYLLEEGSVGVYHGEEDNPQFFAVLEAPTVFGEMALLNPDAARTASVKALSDLRVLTFPIIPCLSSLRRYPTLKEHLVRIVAERSSSPDPVAQHAAMI